MDFKPALFSADDVLQVLGEQMVESESWPGWTEAYGPHFNTEWFEGIYTGGRLTVFRSRDGAWWVLCIEAVRCGQFGTPWLGAWLYGNCVRTRMRDEMFHDDLHRVLFDLPDDVPVPSPDGREVMVPRHDFSILRNGRRERFTPSEEQLATLGLTASRREKELGAMPASDMLRFLSDEIGDRFFASEDTLRDLIEQRRADAEWEEGYRRWWHPLESELELPYNLSHSLDVFLQTRSWTHPRWAWEAWQKPEAARAPLQVFEVLARAIASGDLAEWNAQDPGVFNSHWRFWTESEDWIENLREEYVEALDAQVQVLEPAARDAFIQKALGCNLQHARNSNAWGDTLLFEIGSAVISADPRTLREWLRRRGNRSEDSL